MEGTSRLMGKYSGDLIYVVGLRNMFWKGPNNRTKKYLGSCSLSEIFKLAEDSVSRENLNSETFYFDLGGDTNQFRDLKTDIKKKKNTVGNYV